MTRNEAYWKKRAAQRMFVQMQDTEKRADEIAAYYGNAAKYLSGKMDSIFERYASQYGLSETEARRLLNNLEDKDSLDELKRQLESGQSDLSRSELLRLLEAPAYRARIERFQELQRQIDVLMRNVYRQEKKLSTSHYADVIQKSYYESTFDIQQRAGFGFSVARIDQKQVDALLDSKWSGKNYSSRIWGNTQALAGELKEELMLCLITGKTEREAAERLTLRCAKGASAARRLIRTESCYVSNQMEMQSYQECGIKKYRYLATLDLRTSKICASLDGQVFLVADQQPGKNCPPMHPWCRSTTTAYVSDEELSRMKRRAYNPQTGKTELVPADMHYAEWYAKYVEGKTTASSKKSVAKGLGSGIINSPDTEEGASMMEIRSLGRIDTNILTKEFGKIQTDEIIVTNERLSHIKVRHPEDYELFERFGSESVTSPDLIIKDIKNEGTVFMIKRLPDTNLNVVVRVVLETDNSKLKNSVMTFYRIRERNLKKLIEKNGLLYKKE